MKGFIRKLLSYSLAAALALMVVGCGSNGQDSGAEGNSSVADAEREESVGNVAEGEESAGNAVSGEKIVNVGVTDSLGGVNPFVIDQTEINKYAVGLMFLPLVELDPELNFQGMLLRAEDDRADPQHH